MFSMQNVFPVVVTAFLAAATPAPLSAQNGQSPTSDNRAKQDRVENLINVLQSDASLHEKAVACKWLAVIG